MGPGKQKAEGSPLVLGGFGEFRLEGELAARLGRRWMGPC